VIQIIDHAEGCVLTVRAQPGARRNVLVGAQGDALKVAVTAPPDQGRANKALALLLAEQLGLKKAQVELIAGAASRDKRFLVRGLSAAALAAALTKLLEEH